MAVLIIQILIAFLCGAVFYRLRGGWWHNLTAGDAPKSWWNGTQAMRMIWAVPTAYLMMESANGPLWLWPLGIVSIFVAQTLFGTGQYLRSVPLKWPDLLGFYRNSLALLPVFYSSPLLFALFAILGSCHAFFYWLGFRFRKTDADLGDVMLGGFSWVLIVVCK